MTSERIWGTVKKNRRGPLGFAGNDEEVESREVRQVAIVRGRRRRLIRIPRGLVSIAGADGAPISVDDINGLLDGEAKIRLASSLYQDRKRKTENLKGE